MTAQYQDVLLVEDNPSDLESTLHKLARHNLVNRIKVVRDGEEALEYLFGTYRKESGTEPAVCVPSVILLDLKLPKVNGVEVLGRIKSDLRTRSIPIVVLASSREDPDLYLCNELGVTTYVIKPVDFVNLAEAVRQLGLYWMLLNRRPLEEP